MKDSFSLLEYNPDNLAFALSNSFIDPKSIKSKKFHYKFFLEYFSSHGTKYPGAQTIVIENKYISKSFLYDYSNYYSLCFNQYSPYCKRIHFFNSKFTKDDFLREILSKDSSERKLINDNSYFGYIVVKDLPNVSIGSSLIKPYTKVIDSDREYTVVRNYTVNLFGVDLKIKTLAFQEQDKIISACATTALWSAFHMTNYLFRTSLPTPSVITKSAKNLFISSGRLFPNIGLDHTQIGNTIDSIGLVFELRNNAKFFKGINFFKSFIYGYIKAGIPVLLGFEIDEGIGRHLVTIVGYRKNHGSFKNKKNISLYAEKIEEFYAHDDQVGPFSRLFLDSRSGKLITSWWQDSNGSKKRKAKIVSVFVPIYHKIRLKFEDVLTEIKPFDLYLYKWLPKNDEVVWNIFLDFSNHYKKSIHDVKCSKNFISKVAFVPFPKHIWIARAYLNEDPIIEFVFDSTDLAEGHNCILINFYDKELENFVREEFRFQDFRDSILKSMGKNYLSLLQKELAIIDS